MDEIGLTLEGLLQFGAGAGVVSAAIAVTRWYQKLAAVGEETWTKRLNQMEEDYAADRARWNADLERHDSRAARQLERQEAELATMRNRLDECTAGRMAETAELAALRAEVAALRANGGDLTGS
jgi:transketolase